MESWVPACAGPIQAGLACTSTESLVAPSVASARAMVR